MEHRSTLRTITTVVLGTIACNVALSQPQTGYYQVADLIDSNHVNVRAEPTADSEDLGDIASGSKPYEIIETDPSGDWGRILWLEATGWVALRFMEPIQVEQLAKTEVPVGLVCAGTEPFWTFEIQSQQSALLTTSESTQSLSVTNAESSRNYAAFPAAVELQSDNYSAVSVLRRSQCADGMSEINYSWTVDIVKQPELEVLSGCCFLR